MKLLPFFAAALSLVSCGPKAITHKHPAAHQHSEVAPPTAAYLKNLQEKWNLLARELRIGNNQISLTPAEKSAIANANASNTKKKDALNAKVLKKLHAHLKNPNGFLPLPEAPLDENIARMEDFKNLVTTTIIPRLSKDSYATRGAKLVAFRPSSMITPTYKVDVYEIDYRLQRNFKGEAEPEVRTGLISFPHRLETKKPLPLIVFAHGDDMGLSYEGMSTHLGELQDQAIVIAPSFPGEPICRGDTGKRDQAGHRVLSCANPSELVSPARGVSIPWENDINELLGFYDCVTKVAMNHFRGNSEITDGSVQHLLIEQKNYAATRLKKTFDLHGGLAIAQGFPVSAIFGVSRGGLVGSLALAKAGAAWSISREVKFKPEQILARLGDRYGMMPPASFHGIITLAAPASITIGRYRVVLEQMVKGYGKSVLNPAIPCLSSLTHIFDEFRLDDGNDQERSKDLLAEAAHKVHSRDLSYVGPLMLGALKNWSKPSGKFQPGLAHVAIVHHHQDKIVPIEQSTIAANLLSSFGADKMIQGMTISPLGLDVKLHELTTDPGESSTCHLDFKFKRTQPDVDKIISEWFSSLF